MNVFRQNTPDRAAVIPGYGVTAVLGPTNTGKTHLAIERMLAHSSGLIGLPLRLLAREVYNRLVERAGAAQVALVTGEEKIKPQGARYWVSTAEAMPRDLDVSFLAIDEIQIAGDLERGHVFTDRILNRRGRDETLILGAATMRPIVQRLLPGANIVTRPRLSQLSFVGERKITRQPRRTAIVAFSADEVYAIAELIRRQRGGAAVVLGALSPRTRNAQVALYQSGEVDYLVATDAIGMGLNLDVDHVAFASDRKYDGYQYRRLSPAEFAQVAGRAGRATRDGTFGTTGRCDPFEPELVDALQNHTFDNVKLLQWRNSALDFGSLGALQASLALTPPHEALTRAPAGEDIRVLDHAARDDEVRHMAATATAVERLWEVCQLPDYRRLAPAAHAELVTTLYGFLMRRGNIPDDWLAAQVAQADRVDGDIDTLSARIAQIRTWTFAATRPDWLKDPEHWQDVTRQVEDKLSDALHERLTDRFVDRRTSVLMRRLRENTMLEAEIGTSGDVVVEGHQIGRLEGFMFVPEASEAGNEARALAAAAQKVLASEIDTRAARIAEAGDDQFVLTSDNTVRWVGAAVGKLVASNDVLSPRVRILSDEHLSGPSRDLVQNRLDLWLKTRIEKLLTPMFELARAEDVTGIARGIAFQLNEALGVLDRQKISSDLKDLDQTARASLRKCGVRFGAYHIYFPALLKPAPRTLAAQLWVLKQPDMEPDVLAGVEQLALSGRTSFAADPASNPELYRVLGYKVCGGRAVRVDILERLADLIRPALAWRPNAPGPKPDGAIPGFGFTVTLAMTSLTGSAGEDFAGILRGLGYRMEKRPKPKEELAPPKAETGIEPAQPAEADAAAITPDAATAGEDRIEASAQDVSLSAGSRTGESGEDEAPAVAADETATTDEIAVQPPPAAEAASMETQPAIPAEDNAATEIATVEIAADASVTEPAAEEPDMIEVWRPARPHDERRPRHGKVQGKGPGQTHAQGRDRHPRSEGGRRQGPPAQDEPAEPARQAAGRHARFEKFGRPGGRNGKFAGGKRAHGYERPPREPREKPIDPNSPFAKLAALKAQLEHGGKDS